MRGSKFGGDFGIRGTHARRVLAAAHGFHAHDPRLGSHHLAQSRNISGIFNALETKSSQRGDRDGSGTHAVSLIPVTFSNKSGHSVLLTIGSICGFQAAALRSVTIFKNKFAMSLAGPSSFCPD
jgi:hypothetical protein